MRCSIFYRYANLLAVTVFLLSKGVLFDTGSFQNTSTPDTFPRINQVETISPIPQTTTPEISSLDITPKTTTRKASATTTTASTTTSTSTSQSPVIKIGGRTVSLFNTSSLGTNPGNSVALYGGEFLFAHSSGPFSVLSSASTFQIIRNGQVENYQIVKKVTYCDYSNASQHGARYDCANYGEPVLPARALGYGYNFYEARAAGYDLILMTCAGQSLPGADATHRLLAYAIRV